MKRQGFTLIELLIVTVVIVTLMGVVFRLAGASDEQKARAQTIERLQKLENAISGYYAAYGCYPPVPLQGRSRDIFMAVADNGVQYASGNADTDLKNASVSFKDQGGSGGWSKRMCAQIEAACRAQPVAALFPYNEKKWQRAAAELDLKPLRNYGNQAFDKSDWKECEVFQFGLLSFLLPRYLFMLEGDPDLYDRFKDNRRVGQWAANNRLPCLLDGTKPQNWKEVQTWLGTGKSWNENGSGGDRTKAAMITNLASQAVCARWMPNFKNELLTPDGGRLDFYGVNVSWEGHSFTDQSGSGRNPNFPERKTFSPQGGKGGNSSGGDAYGLNGITLHDGWGHEFYYYSEPPYQSYRVWSAGPNGKTFPPWLDLPTSTEELKAVRACIEDDVVHMSN